MAQSPPPLHTRPWVHLLSVLLSLALHLGFAAPYVAWQELTLELDSPGDGGPDDAPLGNGGGELLEPLGPVNVSVYQEPRRASTPAPSSASSSSGSSGSSDTRGSGTESEASADQDAARGSAAEPTQPTVLREGKPGKPPRGKKKPCEPIDEIVKLGDQRWRIERDVLDWYASHLKELSKQVGVAPHKGPDGKRDGARLWLPRCSVLKQAGMRNGDVVNSVNGRKVNNVAQGVATWLAVRNDRTVKVELTRRDGTQLVHTYRLK